MARPFETLAAVDGRTPCCPLEAVQLAQARGLALRSMNRLVEASAAFDEAMTLAVEHRLSDSTAAVAISRAGNHAFSGRLGAALEDLATAEALADAPLRAQVQTQRAAIMAMSGEFEAALDASSRALAAFRRLGDDLWVARTLHNRSKMHLLTGRVRVGIRDAQEAIALYEQLGQEAGAADCEDNLAGLLAWSGDILTALTRFDLADERKRKLGTSPDAESRIEALLTAGLSADAFTLATAAAEQHRRSGAELLEAEALLAAARAAAALGDRARAASFGRNAQERFDRQGRPSWASRAQLVVAEAEGTMDAAAAQTVAANLTRLGWDEVSSMARRAAANTAIRLGDTASAESLLRGVVAERSGGLLARLGRSQANASLHLLHGDPSGALRCAGRGFRLARRHRRLLGALELRTASARHTQELVSVGLQAARAHGRTSVFWRWTEQARGVDDSGPEANDEQGRELLAQHRAISAQIDADSRDGSRPPNQLLRRRREVEGRLRDRELAAGGEMIAAAAPVTLPTLRRGLGSRTMVALSDVDGEMFATRVTSQGAIVTVVGRTSALETDVDLIRMGLQRLVRSSGDARVEADVRRRLEALDQSFAGLFERTDPGSERPGEIVIVPTGRLFAMPWALLPSLEARSVTVAMSGSLWAASNAPEGCEHALVVDGPGLAGATSEAEMVAAQWPTAARLSEHNATTAQVSRALEHCDIAHIAAHASLRPDNPSFSSLQLVDGPLYVRDLDCIRRAPQIVVMSACASATLLGHRGAEVQGLAAKLLTRGVRAVIAPVLPVSDLATVPVMVEMHRELRGGATPADALCAARRSTGTTDAPAWASAGSYVCLGRGS